MGQSSTEHLLNSSKLIHFTESSDLKSDHVSVECSVSEVKSSTEKVDQSKNNFLDSLSGKESMKNLLGLAKLHDMKQENERTNSGSVQNIASAKSEFSLSKVAAINLKQDSVSDPLRDEVSQPNRKPNFSLAALAEKHSRYSNKNSGTPHSTNQTGESKSTPVTIPSNLVSLKSLETKSENNNNHGSPYISGTVSKHSGISLSQLATDHGKPGQSTGTIKSPSNLTQVAHQGVSSGDTLLPHSPKLPSDSGFSLATLAAYHSKSVLSSASPTCTFKSSETSTLSGNHTGPVVNQSNTVLNSDSQHISLAALAAGHSIHIKRQDRGTQINSESVSSEKANFPPTVSNTQSIKEYVAPSITLSQRGESVLTEQTLAESKIDDKGVTQGEINIPQGEKIDRKSGCEKPSIKAPPGFAQLHKVSLSDLAASHKSYSSPPRTNTLVTVASTGIFDTSRVSELKTVTGKASSFGLALCSKVMHKDAPVSISKSCSKNPNAQSKTSTKPSIIPFDFSTASPDDIVKTRQKGAFTRTGESEY